MFKSILLTIFCFVCAITVVFADGNDSTSIKPPTADPMYLKQIPDLLDRNNYNPACVGGPWVKFLDASGKTLRAACQTSGQTQIGVGVFQSGGDLWIQPICCPMTKNWQSITS